MEVISNHRAMRAASLARIKSSVRKAAWTCSRVFFTEPVARVQVIGIECRVVWTHQAIDKVMKMLMELFD
jgi:hypothetical protein